MTFGIRYTAQCGECRGAYTPQGITHHEPNCDGNLDPEHDPERIDDDLLAPDLRPDRADDPDDDQDDDPDDQPADLPEREVPDLEDDPADECSNCSSADVTDAADARSAYQRRVDDVDPDVIAALAGGDQWCNDCYSVDGTPLQELVGHE